MAISTETIADVYREFEKKCLPADAGANQRIETRRAFYAGCATMFGLVTSMCSTDSDDDGEALLSRLSSELEAYVDELREIAEQEDRERAKPARRRAKES